MKKFFKNIVYLLVNIFGGKNIPPVKPKKLFEQPYDQYPSDTYGGRYREFEGRIISVSGYKDDDETDDLAVIIENEEWDTWEGFAEGPLAANLRRYKKYFPNEMHLLIATIRVYDCGGGWYPSNRITGIRSISGHGADNRFEQINLKDK